jgi:hypothetical protein
MNNHMEKLREMSKLEKSISNLVMKLIDKSKLKEPDNLALAMVEINDTESYGKVCKVTMLFNQSFKKDDSDLLYDLNRKNKETINKLFDDYFNRITFQSQSTIENYIEHYQSDVF